MSKSSHNKGILVVMAIAATAVVALGFYIKQTPSAARVPTELRRQESSSSVFPQVNTSPKPEVHAEEQDRPTVHLSKIDGSNAALATESTEVPAGKEPMQYLAETIAKDAGLSSVRVLNVDLRDHVAIVNFSSELKQGMGSMQEGAFIKSLQTGYGQFANVDKVWINVEGQPIDSIGEHFEVVDPLPVLRPGESAKSKPVGP